MSILKKLFVTAVFLLQSSSTFAGFDPWDTIRTVVNQSESDQALDFAIRMKAANRSLFKIENTLFPYQSRSGKYATLTAPRIVPFDPNTGLTLAIAGHEQLGLNQKLKNEKDIEVMAFNLHLEHG